MAKWEPWPGQKFGYADWEAAQSKVSGEQVVALFIELGFPLQEILEKLARFNDAGDRDVVVPPHELERLEVEMKLAAAQTAADVHLRLVLYARRKMIPVLEGLLGRVIHVGPPVGGEQVQAILSDSQRILGTTRGRANPLPIAAVIDDGIPFLNARFRKPGALDRTRFRAVWVQTDARLTGKMKKEEVEIGRVLRGEDINELLRLGSEADHYRDINGDLLPVNQRSSTNHRVSHGAHVLDIMAGADPIVQTDPVDEMLQVPLLAVQLPPASVRDTSGRRNEGMVVQGLRWCIAEALARAAENEDIVSLTGGKIGTSPLVVTITLGALAGPSDGRAFLADWFDYEIKRYEALASQTLTIVCAYGNAHRQKLVARDWVSKSAPLQVDWRIQPDDHSPSFLEIRLDETKAGPLHVVLIPPGPEVPSLKFKFERAAKPKSGPKGKIVRGAEGPAAAVLTLVEENHRALLIAIAPTARVDGGTIAPAGTWKVSVTSDRKTPIGVTLRVQRDDTPAGYRTLGRQSWLDHKLAWEWDPQTRDWIMPLPPGGSLYGSCPVSRQGTAVAHAGAINLGIVFAGSVKPRLGYPAAVERVASLYSAEGAAAHPANPGSAAGKAPVLTGETDGPTLAALADDGSNLFGRYAGAVLSRAVARISGTSVAAPAVARSLIYKLLEPSGVSVRQPGPAAVRKDGGLIGWPPLPPLVKNPLTGYAILAGQKPYTRGSVIGP